MYVHPSSIHRNCCSEMHDDSGYYIIFLGSVPMHDLFLTLSVLLVASPLCSEKNNFLSPASASRV